MNWLERKIVLRPGLWLLGPVGLAILLSPAVGFAQPGRGYTPPPYTPPPYTPPPQNFNTQNFAQQQQMRTQQETQNRIQDDASRRMDQFRSSNQQDAFRMQRESEQSRRSSQSSSGGANPNGFVPEPTRPRISVIEVLVTFVEPNSQCAALGVQTGDIVASYNGIILQGVQHFGDVLLRQPKDGNPVEMVVLRANAELKIAVVPGRLGVKTLPQNPAYR